MKVVTYLFADLAALLEDLHAIAVEGQSAGASFDEYAALSAMIDAGACEVRGTVAAIRATLLG